MMRSLTAPAALAAVLIVGGCVTPPAEPLPDLKPGERPDISSDEAGLWMQMDEVEKRLSTSGRVVHDRKLNEYVKGVTCRLSPEYCQDLRLYIVETPHFNASMAPNGTMQVWTGTLLRVQNEAQLAYVLGHEMAHYIRRHSVQQWRSIRRKSDAMAFFTVSTSMAGLGFMGDLAELAAMASVMAFSRDHERESDDIGFKLMTDAGYEAAESPKIWEALIAERDAAGGKAPSIFFSSHPTSEERIDTLKAQAASLAGSGRTNDKQYLRATSRFRGQWLQDELRKRDYEGTQVVLKTLRESGYRTGEIYYYEGELYRLRGEDGDLEQAIESYRKALSGRGTPPEVHRSLGLAYWKTGQPRQARKSFLAYLSAAPKADDREMVKSYIEQLQ